METDKWFPQVGGACDKSQTARATLYCLGHAGGTPADFAAWDAQHASPALRVRPVCLPGRPPRHHEPCPTSITAAATAIAAAIERDFAPAAPSHALVLYGESYGALLAFETARRLSASTAARLAAVVVASRAPPSTPSSAPDDSQRFSRIADDSAFIDAVARAYGDPLLARVATASGDSAAPLVARLRADLGAYEAYTGATARLACPVLACRGRDDPATTAADMVAWACDFGAAGSAMRTYEGGHFFARDAVVAHTLVSDIEAFVGQCTAKVLVPTAATRQHDKKEDEEEEMLMCF